MNFCRTRSGLLVLLLAFALPAAACSGEEADDGATTTEVAGDTNTPESSDADSDVDDANTNQASSLAGTTVSVLGSESSEEEAGAMQEALDAFSEETGIIIEYTGTQEFSAQINAQASSGNSPDIGVFPQPGKVAEFARQGLIKPIPENVVAVANANWPADWNNFGVVDDTQFAVPNKADLKSVVWYQPSRFEELGYEIPTTLEQFVNLVETAAEDGNTPLCVGIESQESTGWPFTDWTEEMVLRVSGPDVYDDWVNHEIPFNSPEITGPMQQVVDLWNIPGSVFAAGDSIATTPVGDNGAPLVAGDCLMHRQASFFSAFIPAGTGFADGSDGAIDVFYFPADEGKPILVAGTLAAAFDDRPEVWAVMEYFTTADYADARQTAQAALKGEGPSGFLSAANGLDPSLYEGLEKHFVETILGADIARFDASDQMPAAVGAGTFWTEGTLVVNGDKSVGAAADAIEASWPTS